MVEIHLTVIFDRIQVPSLKYLGLDSYPDILSQRAVYDASSLCLPNATICGMCQIIKLNQTKSLQ